MFHTAFITGASGGIGRATALLLAQRGCAVALLYHTGQKAAHLTAGEITSAGGRALALCANVADPTALARAFAKAQEELGGVDILINNAGITHFGLLQHMTAAQWDEVFAVNVRGMFNCARQALPGMVSRKWGRIVNVSSIWGITGASCEVAYSASKAAVIGLTKALAREVAPSGITVNCVAPGAIKTGMLAALTPAELAGLTQATPVGRLGRPEDIARAIAFFALDDTGFTTGQVLSQNGGWEGA